jgi:serine/threonine protein kinase
MSLNQETLEKILQQLDKSSFFEKNLQYKLHKKDSAFSLLGKGASSYVYDIVDKDDENKHYALKIISNFEEAQNNEAIKRCIQTQYNFSVQSENIVRIITHLIIKVSLSEKDKINKLAIYKYEDDEEYNSFKGITFTMIIMEKLDKLISRDRYGNVLLLKDNLKKPESILKFALDVSKAIYAIHMNNYLHRDIKLENIFWDNNSETYKLGDLGVISYIGEDNAQTRIFTNGYGAPEIERRLRESYNTSADIYSFGIVLYLLFNDLKFPASDGYYVNPVQYDNDFIMPAPINASFEIAGLIRKMTNFNPDMRIQSIEEVIFQLNSIINKSYKEDFKIGFSEDIETVYCDDIPLKKHIEGEKENSIENKKWDDMTYEEKLQEKISNDKIYFWQGLELFLISLPVLFTLYMSLSLKDGFMYDWKIWVLPIAFFAEIVFKFKNIFFRPFSFLFMAFLLFCFYDMGFSIIFLVCLIVNILGSKILILANTIALTGWIFQYFTGYFSFLNSMKELNIITGLLFATFILVVIRVFIIEQLFGDNKNEHLDT